MLIFTIASPATAVTNPHVDTADGSSCLFCHVKGFDTPEVSKSGYTLLESTIDAVCLRCHTKNECCRIGQEHKGGLDIGANSHPSDIEGGDIKRASLPETLPLQGGKMTCNTCHFHRRPAGQDYKLVRLVSIKDTEIDWTALCQDCHKTQ
jgi:hypothetical protein